ncbi:MAG: amino acid adenylation domain-containing protein, partial [Nitratireductor sp.]|nr:amino acid adenylation domain-containing protein [Nitratireductor sp.]
WRTANLGRDENDRLIDFWLGEVDGTSGDLSVLAEWPRREVPTYRGERIRVRLSGDICDGLRRIAANANVTLFVTILAAFEVLIQRLSGQGDFVISTVVDNRPARLREGLVGFLLNTIPIRARLKHDTRFTDYLQFASERMARVLVHSEVPFDRLVQKAGYRRENLASLKQVMFGFMPKESRGRQWPSATFEPLNFDHGRAHFDLSFVLAEAGGQIEGHVEFSTDVFDRPAVQRIIRRFTTLLEDIVADPDRRVDQFNVLPDEERALVSAWSVGKAVPYPRDANVPAVFRETANEYTENTAIAYGETEITYWQLDQWSDRLANMLRAKGMASGDVVAISAERKPALAAGLLAILKAGAAYLAVEPGMPENRVRHIIEASGARLMLAQGEAHPGAAGIPSLPIPESFDSGPAGGSAPQAEIRPEGIAYICYTSGSTGNPKGALISHRSILRLVKGADYARLGPDERTLQLSSVAFDASTFEIWGALLNGSTLVQPQVGQPTISELANTIMEEGITTLWMTAGLFHKVVDMRLDCFRHVRQMLAGGDVLSTDHVRRFLAAHPHSRFINGYGPTENTTFSTCCAVQLADLETGAVPIGRPIANSTAYVLDERLRLLPIGVEGDLYVGGDGVALGYLNMPEETAESFMDDPFSPQPGARMYRTGDRARMLSGGNIDFRGRRDTQIKIRGFRVELQEIEAVLRRNPDIGDAVAVPRREDGGAVRSLAAFVTPAPGGGAIDPASVRRMAARDLPDYMVPGEIVAVSAFPLTPNAKVDRKALLELDAGTGGEQDFVAPRTPVEKLVAGLWSELLELEKIGIDDDFFDLGGHSLLVLQLAMRLEEEIALSMDYGDFFRFPTIRMLALEITQRLLLLEEEQAFETVGPEHPHG